MPLLSAHRVYKTYRLGRVDVPVLRGVHLEVEEGECVAVLGASGSGKSTLLHILGGLDRPDRAGPRGTEHESDVVFEGRSLRSLSPSQLDRYRNRSVGFVFQFYHLLPELTVLHNAALPALVGLNRLTYAAKAGEIRARAEALLSRFGLAHRLRHRPVELSGGERQRVAIARALINKPKLLLADEPTGNLDQATGATILDAIMDLRAELNQTIIMVTHDPNTAARADRIVRLKDGVVEGEARGHG